MMYGLITNTLSCIEQIRKLHKNWQHLQVGVEAAIANDDLEERLLKEDRQEECRELEREVRQRSERVRVHEGKIKELRVALLVAYGAVTEAIGVPEGPDTEKLQ